jgi:hypothetical protein
MAELDVDAEFVIEEDEEEEGSSAGDASEGRASRLGGQQAVGEDVDVVEAETRRSVLGSDCMHHVASSESVEIGERGLAELERTVRQAKAAYHRRLRHQLEVSKQAASQSYRGGTRPHDREANTGGADAACLEQMESSALAELSVASAAVGEELAVALRLARQLVEAPGMKPTRARPIKVTNDLRGMVTASPSLMHRVETDAEKRGIAARRKLHAVRAAGRDRPSSAHPAGRDRSSLLERPTSATSSHKGRASTRPTSATSSHEGRARTRSAVVTARLGAAAKEEARGWAMQTAAQRMRLAREASSAGRAPRRRREPKPPGEHEEDGDIVGVSCEAAVAELGKYRRAAGGPRQHHDRRHKTTKEAGSGEWVRPVRRSRGSAVGAEQYHGGGHGLTRRLLPQLSVKTLLSDSESEHDMTMEDNSAAEPTQILQQGDGV